jgi:phosphoserine phosphatase RsbU/P
MQTEFKTLIEQTALRVSECISCSWAVVLVRDGTDITALRTVGRHPDLARCLAEAPAFWSGHRMVGEGLPAAKWMPRITCPVYCGGDAVAVLAFGPQASGGDYSEDDRNLVFYSAARVSSMISHPWFEDGIAGESELAVARKVQDRLFPSSLPAIARLDYHGECEAIGELGGDFFDFIPGARSSLLLSIGDVAGKGVPAAIIMAAIQGCARGLGLRKKINLSKLVRDLNRVVWQLSPDNVYATMFYARVNSELGILEYVNAGHDRIFLIRDHLRTAEVLDSTGTVLGLSMKSCFPRRTISIRPGDVLVALTDGITDAVDAAGRVIDEQIILNAVRAHPDDSSADLTGHIIRAVDRFSRGTEASDDRTVVVVRVTAPAASAAAGVRAFTESYAAVA